MCVMSSRTPTTTRRAGKTTDSPIKGRSMAKTHTPRDAHDGVGDRYLELIHRFPLRPIRSDAELDRAIEVIDSLVDRDDLAGGGVVPRRPRRPGREV